MWNMMRILIGVLAALSGINFAQAAVIGYDPRDAGRTGDKLIQVAKALWVSHLFNQPFVSSPFKYSDKLMLHLVDDEFAKSAVASLAKVKVMNEKTLDLRRNVLYQVGYKFKATFWEKVLEVTTWKGLFDNEEFLKKLRTYVAPSFFIKPIAIPKDHISVAVHVRKGGGIDHPLYSDKIRRTFADHLWPVKFPPESYYIKQIQQISVLLQDQPLYVHIFTDDRNPRQIVERFKKAVTKNNITYGCRENANFHDSNVLEDLFNMTRFDCLIRGGSNYGQVVHLLGDYKIAIYAKDARWHGNQMHVDVGIVNKLVS